MSVYVNRSLNLKNIKAIGLDMDYTLVRYHTEEFETLTYYSLTERLVSFKGYPKSLTKLKFDFDKIIQGLVIDKKLGNILKLSRYGKVKSSFHGTAKIDFDVQKQIYANQEIDLSLSRYQSLDTFFSIAHGVIFGQLVSMKDHGENLPNYDIMADDIKDTLDLIHQDGTLKSVIADHLNKYIIREPELVHLLEHYKESGKRLMIITNSEYPYTKLLLDYTINPFLKKHKNWMELFEVVIASSMKPRFFTENSPFLRIDPESGLMSNVFGAITPGIYQGGSAKRLAKDLKLNSDEVLYIGDHIYGDVVKLKKTFGWRTALVFSNIVEEVASIKKGAHAQAEIDRHMDLKARLEDEVNRLHNEAGLHGKHLDKKQLEKLQEEIDELNTIISTNIKQYQNFFNPHWGERMRAGVEESMMAGQMEKYACIYMSKVSDLLAHSPTTYFRPQKRILPHERNI